MSYALMILGFLVFLSGVFQFGKEMVIVKTITEKRTSTIWKNAHGQEIASVIYPESYIDDSYELVKKEKP